jgi:hypothetical protein
MREGPSKTLASYGITQSWPVRARIYLFAVATIGLALAAFFVTLWLSMLKMPVPAGQSPPINELKPVEMAQFAIVLAGAVITFWQWSRARFEASLEKFYERLDIANRHLSTMIEKSWDQCLQNSGSSTHISIYDNPPNVGVSLFDMRVFAELDNLEYVVEKYRQGYIEPRQACRGLQTFISRCERDAEFRSRASYFVRASAYHKNIVPIVDNICNKVVCDETDKTVASREGWV